MNNTTNKVTGRLIAAGRVLAGIGMADLANASTVSIETLRHFESSGSAWLPPGTEVESVTRALEKFDVVLCQEGEGMGAGVRLKFTRTDVRQIMRLEGEGGNAETDEVP